MNFSEVLQRIGDVLGRFLDATGFLVRSYVKTAIALVLIVGFGLVWWARTGFSLQLGRSQAAPSCVQYCLDDQGNSYCCGTDTGSTPVPTPGSPSTTTPPPATPGTPPGNSVFPDCFEWDANGNGDGNFSEKNAIGNPTNVIPGRERYTTLSYQGNYRNTCSWTVHLLFNSTGSKKGGGEPTGLDQPTECAFTRTTTSGTLDIKPGQSGTWKVTYDVNRFTCGRVGAFASWRHYTPGGNRDSGLFSVVFNYGRDCRGTTAEKPPGSCTGTVTGGGSGGTGSRTVPRSTVTPQPTTVAAAPTPAPTPTPVPTSAVGGTGANDDFDGDGVLNSVECPGYVSSGNFSQCADGNRDGIPDVAQADVRYVPGSTPVATPSLRVNQVGSVKTGPGDAVLLALIISAAVSLAYVSYVHSPLGRRSELEELREDQGPLDFRS